MISSKKNVAGILLCTFILMALMVTYTTRVIYRTAFRSVEELGVDKTTAITAELENYMDMAKSVLWVAADTVDHMVANGATDEEIVEYITRESTNTEAQFDESYTGIYGYINGNYVDGVGWVPPVDYDPTVRDWYKTTVAGKGDVVIVSPYVDAQTGKVIISIGRSLSNNENALALDLTLDGVQEIVEDIQINGYGYGYIVNNDGMVIAHPDQNEKGKNYNEIPEQKELFQKVSEVGKGSFVTDIDGDKCTVFVDTVMDQWYLVIVTKNSELYNAPMSLMIVSIIISLIVFGLTSTFYVLGYRSERKSYQRLEEMKEIERQKDYEAKVLKLEKTAADSANKAKSDFLADMSHEIRTPINAILGMNEMILHQSKEEETLEYASNIKGAGKTLLAIINTILDFSKIEDGRMSLVPVEFETSVMVNGLVNSISERARTKGLELKLDIDDTIPSVLYGDDVRISQVIMNLLTNAVKYTEKGYVQFKISNLGTTSDYSRLLVSVKDTGIGIKKEDIDKLSISFERVDEEKNRHIEGTGLGISIVTKLLDMMNSELKIKSEYGVGSEFYFELPIKVVDGTPIGQYEAGRKRLVDNGAASDVLISAPKANILITDDNEMNRKVASNLMRLFGITPDLCKSGAETIETMKKKHYDMLFLDHMMPEMDGIETLKILKELGLVDNTKVVALTANAVVGAREQYLDAGFDDYISKPIELSEMDKIFNKYLSEEKVEAPIAPEDNKIKSLNLDGLGMMDKLKSLDINVEEGISYCGDDEEFYIEIVNDYIKAAPEKIEQLNALLEAGDMKEYKVLIHSVKSSSKTIGCMSLFEKARDLEAAAASGNIDYVKTNHRSVVSEYKNLVEALESK
ncbi:MAG: response regulator [Eubacterium sp.]|nr:response regulator [Eubacterium sp.]